MEIFKKLALIVLILGSAYMIKTVFYPTTPVDITDIDPKTEHSPKVQEKQPDENSIKKETISVYFIGQNSNKEEVYKIVSRNYDPEHDGTKLDYAINVLLKGPNVKESAQGIYSEIPKGTKLRAISKVNGKLYIDLSEDFEQGGGTDGLYKRLYQLIKTVNRNTTENVYLKLDGREVDVIGGEGIMLQQPLNPHSLDE